MLNFDSLIAKIRGNKGGIADTPRTLPFGTASSSTASSASTISMPAPAPNHSSMIHVPNHTGMQMTTRGLLQHGESVVSNEGLAASVLGVSVDEIKEFLGKKTEYPDTSKIPEVGRLDRMIDTEKEDE